MSVNNCSSNGGTIIFQSGSPGVSCSPPTIPDMHDPIIITAQGKVRRATRYNRSIDTSAVMSINNRGITRFTKSTI
jgi:hypothetical protein